MEDLLPEGVLESLREHYYAGVMAAEIGYEHNAADEDAVTGGLGQELLTKGIRYVEDRGRLYSWRGFHYKLGGRGKGAPERWFGADGIFQLEVFSLDPIVVRRKALLFQAKKEWRGANQKLWHQAEQMAEYSPSAIVVDYRHSGFVGVAGDAVIEARGNRRALREGSQLPLAEILGVQFVRCRRGDVGVFWNPETQSLEVELGMPVQRRILPAHFMTTTVQQLR